MGIFFVFLFFLLNNWLRELDAHIMGIKWQNFITNTKIRERANSDTIAQLRWLGHVCRMSDGRLPKQILFGELSHGQRYSGGQLKRHKDVIHSMVKKAGIQDTWESMCQDRGSWRNICYNNSGIHNTVLRTGGSTTETFVCSECQSSIRSRIGFWSHQQTHERRSDGNQ